MTTAPRVTRRDGTLVLSSEYTWSPERRVFHCSYDQVRIDAGGIDDVEFYVCSGVHIRVGQKCSVIGHVGLRVWAGPNCTVWSGPNSVIEAGDGCSIMAGADSTFHVGDRCSIVVRSAVGCSFNVGQDVWARDMAEKTDWTPLVANTAQTFPYDNCAR